MQARVVTVQYQSGKLDEGLQIFINSVMPASRQQPGYKGALALVDRTTGKAIAIGLRETVADMQVTETSGYLQEQFAKFTHLLAAPPTVEVYEVIVQVHEDTPTTLNLVLRTAQETTNTAKQG